MIDSKTFKRHEKTINKYAGRIIELEKELKKIKGSPDWIAAINYFGKMKYDRKILESPTEKNGYKIKHL